MENEMDYQEMTYEDTLKNIVEQDFTCDTCLNKTTCMFAYDELNVNGFCILEEAE